MSTQSRFIRCIELGVASVLLALDVIMVEEIVDFRVQK